MAAILLACVSALSATAAWTLLLLPAGNVRFNPLFWLLVVPFCLWFWPLARYQDNALRRLPLSLLAWPLVGCTAALSAGLIPEIGATEALAHDKPVIPWIGAALSVLAAMGSYIAWRRRSSTQSVLSAGAPAAPSHAATDVPAASAQPPGWLGMGAPLVVFILFWLVQQSARIQWLSWELLGAGAACLVGYFGVLVLAIRRDGGAAGRTLGTLALVLAPAICLALTGLNAAFLLHGPDPARTVFGWIMLGVTVLCAVSAWRSFRRRRTN